MPPFQQSTKSSRLRLEALEDRLAPADVPLLLKDINPGGGSAPSQFVQAGGLVYFSADAFGGPELWKTDGTTANTDQVKDINPSGIGGGPSSITSIGNRVFFATTDANDNELWVSDGSDAGTKQVKDIDPGDSSSFPQFLTNLNGTLYFTASTAATGSELWKSDGTANGTVQVIDLNPGAQSTAYQLIFAYQNKLYMVILAGGGQRVFRLNDEGTGLVQFGPDFGVSPVGNFVGAGNNVYFVQSDSSQGVYNLWTVDASTDEVTLLRAFPRPSLGSPMAILGPHAYFGADANPAKAEMWRTDATVAGTALFKDINTDSGTGNSFANNFTTINDEIYFTATVPATGQELWKSDGTPEGTVLVRDIRLGSTGSDPSRLMNVSGSLVFTATNNGGIELLMRYDPINDILIEVPNYDSYSNFTPIGEALYFQSRGPEAVFDEPYTWDLPPNTPDIDAFTFDSGILGDNLTNDTTPTLSGRVDWQGLTVTVRDNGNVIDSFITNAGGHWSWTAPTLADGLHSFTVQATDPSGQSSGDSAPFSLTIDTVPPTTPIITSVADDTNISGDGITFDNTLLLTGTADANTTVAIFDNSTLLAEVATGLPGNWSFATQPLSDGSHLFVARAVDAAANIADSPATNFTVDTVAPVAPVIVDFTVNSGSIADRLTNDTTPTFSGTAESGTTVELFRDGVSVGSTTVLAGFWSVGVTQVLGDGTHAFTAIAMDGAGNVSPSSDSFSITIDSQRPDQPNISGFTIDSNILGDGITKHSSIVVSGTAEPLSTLDLFDGAIPIEQVTVAGNGDWTVNLSSLGDGLHSLNVQVTDAAGNISDPSATLDVTVDTAAPVKPALTGWTDDSGTIGDGLTNDTTPTLSGTAEVGSTIRIFEGVNLLGETTAAGGNWSTTISPLANGNHPLSITATDVAGNESIQTTLNIEIDTVAPIGQVNELDEVSPTLNFPVAWAGADVPKKLPVTFDVYVSDDGGSWTLWQDNTSQPSAVFSGAEYHSYRFYALARDRAGNREPDSAQAETTILATDGYYARDDSFGADAGKILRIGAGTGPLANDLKRKGHLYDIDIVTQPALGSLTMKKGGGFIYTPSGTFAGVDQFTYRIKDLTTVTLGNIATVTLATHLVALRRAKISVREAAPTGSIWLDLRKTATQATAVDYTVRPNTANQGADFSLASGTLTFQPGERRKLIIFQVHNDIRDELAETFRVILSNPQNVELGMIRSSTITIADNDAPPKIGFALATATVSEGAAEMLIDVSLSAISEKTITVEFYVPIGIAGGSAQSGTDYVLARGTLTIAAGETTGQIRLTLIDNTASEADETVIVRLTKPINGRLINAKHTLTIDDND